MSSSGSNGGGSSRATWLSPFRPASSLLNQSAPAGSPSRPGINNFLHGMHSFQSANELQFYVERMSGPGAIVNVTGIGHMPFRQEGSSSMAPPPGGNRGMIMGPQPLSVSTTAGRTSSFAPYPQEPTGPFPSLGNSGNNGIWGTRAVPPGYERNTYLVACELHSNVRAIGPPSNNGPSVSPDGVLQLRSGVFYFDYCEVCQAVTVADTHGHSMTFPE